MYTAGTQPGIWLGKGFRDGAVRDSDTYRLLWYRHCEESNLAFCCCLLLWVVQGRQQLLSCQSPVAAGSTSYLLTPFYCVSASLADAVCRAGSPRNDHWAGHWSDRWGEMVQQERTALPWAAAALSCQPRLFLLDTTSRKLDPPWIHWDSLPLNVLGLNKILRGYPASIACSSQINYLCFPQWLSEAKYNDK